METSPTAESPRPTVKPAAKAKPRDFFADARAGARAAQHPRPTYLLLFMHMWERFCYYGIASLLVTYLVDSTETGGHSLSADSDTLRIVVGVFVSLTYLLPLVGGYVADRYIGYRFALVAGGVFMTAGHCLVAINNFPSLCLGIGFLVAGNGLFVPNVMALFGKFYPEKGNLKDAAYVMLYMGATLGMVGGVTICQYLQSFGWVYVFAATITLMVAGLLHFWLGSSTMGNVGLRPSIELDFLSGKFKYSILYYILYNAGTVLIVASLVDVIAFNYFFEYDLVEALFYVPRVWWYPVVGLLAGVSLSVIAIRVRRGEKFIELIVNDLSDITELAKSKGLEGLSSLRNLTKFTRFDKLKGLVNVQVDFDKIAGSEEADYLKELANLRDISAADLQRIIAALLLSMLAWAFWVPFFYWLPLQNVLSMHPVEAPDPEATATSLQMFIEQYVDRSLYLDWLNIYNDYRFYEYAPKNLPLVLLLFLTPALMAALSFYFSLTEQQPPQKRINKMLSSLLLRQKMHPIYKMSFGLVYVSLSFLLMAYATRNIVLGQTGETISYWWVIGGCVLLAFGEVLFVPMQLSLVSKLAPARVVGFLFGWQFFSLSIASMISYEIVEYARVEASHPEGLPMVNMMLLFSGIAVGGAVLLFLFFRPLSRMMKGVS